MAAPGHDLPGYLPGCFLGDVVVYEDFIVGSEVECDGCADSCACSGYKDAFAHLVVG